MTPVYFMYVTRIAVFILWRAFQIAVVIPATVVAIALVLYTLGGHSLVPELVAGIHGWAETDVCPAPAGTVFVQECVPPLEIRNPPVDTGVLKPVLCVAPVAKATPIDEFAQDVDQRLRSLCSALYGVLLIVAFFVVTLAYSGRRFFGLGERSAQTCGDPSDDSHAKEPQR